MATEGPIGELIELSQEIETHLKLLRDYASSPGDLWLARGELSKINSLMAEVSKLLNDIELA